MIKVGSIVILKDGEFDKLPTPECYRGLNMLQYHNIPKDAKFTVDGFQDDNTCLRYEFRAMQIKTSRLIDILEQREHRLNELGIC